MTAAIVPAVIGEPSPQSMIALNSAAEPDGLRSVKAPDRAGEEDPLGGTDRGLGRRGRERGVGDRGRRRGDGLRAGAGAGVPGEGTANGGLVIVTITGNVPLFA